MRTLSHEMMNSDLDRDLLDILRFKVLWTTILLMT